MNHEARIIANRKEPVYFVKYDSEVSSPRWFYLQVSQIKERAFLSALKKTPFDCGDYGKVLASGYGTQPPEHVEVRLKEEGLI